MIFELSCVVILVVVYIMVLMWILASDDNTDQKNTEDWHESDESFTWTATYETPELTEKKESKTLKPEKFTKIKTIRDFTSHITRLEGGKKKISVAQVAEVLKLVNKETQGEFYKFLKRGY